MREVFSGHDSTLVGFYQSMLEGEGIRCFVRGFHDGYAGIEGIVLPTLCVTDDADHDRAVELVRQAQAGEASPQSDWTCPACRETVPGNFDVCWKCGAERPA